MAAELTQNSILRMSDDKTMQLIDLYEKEECLWNTNSEDYKNRERRSKAAERIANALNMMNFESRHVIIKFKNLRNSYCQELKKISHSLNSGLGDEEIYRPRVFWFNKMDSFLRPHLQPARGVNGQCATGLLPRVKKEPEDTEEVEEWIQMTNPEDVLLLDASDDLRVHSCSDNEQVETKRPRKRPRIQSRNSKKARIDDGLEQKALAQTLKDITAQLLNLSSQKEDYFDNFGKYIASLLRSMPAEKALHLQPKIVSMIASSASSAAIGIHEAGRVSQSDENVTDTTH